MIMFELELVTGLFQTNFKHWVPVNLLKVIGEVILDF